MSHRSASDDLTQRVLETYSRIDDPRLREIVVALIRHLHTYVKEVGLKREEWETAWSLMAKMAENTGPRRNEFLLLGDLIGVSQLVETLGHKRPEGAVGYALVGPFYRANAPLCRRGESIASVGHRGGTGADQRQSLQPDGQCAHCRCDARRLAGGHERPV